MRKGVLGGVIGAVVTLLFLYSYFYLWNVYFSDISSFLILGCSISWTLQFMAPMAGGFLAGLIAKEDAKLAGWLAGSLAGLVMIIALAIPNGYTLETFVGTLVEMVVLVVISRVFAGFAMPK